MEIKAVINYYDFFYQEAKWEKEKVKEEAVELISLPLSR